MLVGPVVGLIDTIALVTVRDGVSVTFGPIPTSVCTSREAESEVVPKITSRSPLAPRRTSVITTPDTTLLKKELTLLTVVLTTTFETKPLKKPKGFEIESATVTADVRKTLIAPLIVLRVDEITTIVEKLRVRFDSLLSVDVIVSVEVRLLRFGSNPVIT